MLPTLLARYSCAAPGRGALLALIAAHMTMTANKALVSRSSTEFAPTAQVVNSLAKNQPHVTFRQTKLTSVLKDALGGNCKTVMIACCWPEEEFLEETLSTLRFALRVKSLTTTATVSEKTDPATAIRCAGRQQAAGVVGEQSRPLPIVLKLLLSRAGHLILWHSGPPNNLCCTIAVISLRG